MSDTMADADYVGFLKYNGKLVEDGIMDARTSAKALLGFDRALRYCIAQKNAELAATDFEIPVRIQKGSWTAFIPHTVGQWVLATAGIVATTYLTTAAKKLAENDSKEKGIKDIFKSAMSGLQWLIKIGKHLGSFDQRKPTGIVWRNNNEDVGIPNPKGVILYVPRWYFELYLNCPISLLSDIVSIVQSERNLVIGVSEGEQIVEEGVKPEDRYIFYVDEDGETDVLFPHLVHGQKVQLEGFVTRGNETSNSIGFKHEEHILTCYPSTGSIVRFKEHLFLKCRIIGHITRAGERGGFNDPRPKIIFDELIILDEEVGQEKLL
jgi:hypothetical protein